jgi:hypothetical protein
MCVLTGLVMAGPASAAAGWSVVSVPHTGNNTELNAMSARTNTDAWAVGTQFGAAGQTPPPPVAYHWNGSAWSLTATPSLGLNAGLNAVSAGGATDAWAVGFTIPAGTDDRVALYEHWNGSAWKVVSGPGRGLNGLADLSASNAWAVGDLGAVEHWNGTAWSIVPSPTPGAYPTLNAVAARSASDVYAVGFNEPSVNGGVQQGMILRWTGSKWSADTDPTAGTFSPLYGAATLAGAASEWAAGINGTDQALVLSHG